MSNVTVYSKASCVQCTATTRALDAQGLDYDVVKIDEDMDAYDYVTSGLGFRQAPVVEVGERGASVQGGDNVWSGYMPDNIKRIPDMLDAMKSPSLG